MAFTHRVSSVSDIVEIPVGEYVIGDDGVPNAGPRHRRKLREPVWIDARPVTWAHYEAFVAGGGYSQDLLERCSQIAGGAARSVDQRTEVLVEQFLQLTRRGFASNVAARCEPITGLTWFEASAVAQFYGARLPYEVEWEIANSGRTKGDKASTDSENAGGLSKLGCARFIGRLQEWTLDAFSKRYWRADFEKRGNAWFADNSKTAVTVRGAGPEDMFRHVSYRSMSGPSETNVFRGFRRVWDTCPAADDIMPSWERH